MDWQRDSSCMTDSDEGLGIGRIDFMNYMDIDVQELSNFLDGLVHRHENCLPLMA